MEAVRFEQHQCAAKRQRERRLLGAAGALISERDGEGERQHGHHAHDERAVRRCSALHAHRKEYHVDNHTERRQQGDLAPFGADRPAHDAVAVQQHQDCAGNADAHRRPLDRVDALHHQLRRQVVQPEQQLH